MTRLIAPSGTGPVYPDAETHPAGDTPAVPPAPGPVAVGVPAAGLPGAGVPAGSGLPGAGVPADSGPADAGGAGISVLDEITDVVVRIGPQGTLTYINRAWYELTGNPVADTVGLDPLANVHPDDRALAVEHMTAAITGSSSVREVRFLTRDGGIRWMEVRGRVLTDAEGNGVGFSGVLHDVTERKEAENRIRAARDEAERARSEAEQAREEAERAREEAERAQGEAEQAREEAERAREEAEQAREEAERARDEAELARDEAELARDEAERASRAKNEFLSRISHELRTPLNAILGFSQLLEYTGLHGEDADNLAMISRAGRHLLNLINDLMDVTRIESGRLAMSLEPVAVAEVVAESVSLIRPSADARRITVRTPTGGDLAHLVADRQRLIQVLVNLLSNAVKYNREGGRVRVDWHRHPAGEPLPAARYGVIMSASYAGPVSIPSAGPVSVPGADPVPALPAGACGVGGVAPGAGWLRIEVADTGPGIPADRLADVFVPFERLGAQLTDVEGAGIGLAITQGLVEAMDGRIGVRNAPEGGSVFHVDLPLWVGAGGGPAVPEHRSDPATADPAHTVLYIEDNPSNVTLMNRIFVRRPAVRLLDAADAPTGLAMAREHRPDLILLDLHLPGCEDGAQVVAQLRADRDPQLRAIPVVMVTADLTAGTERRLRTAGATGFVPKPLDIPALLATVDRHLSQAIPQAHRT